MGGCPHISKLSKSFFLLSNFSGEVFGQSKCITRRFVKRQHRYLSFNHKPVNFWLKSTIPPYPPPQQLPLGLISSLMWTILGKMSTLLLGVEFPRGGRGRGASGRQLSRHPLWPQQCLDHCLSPQMSTGGERRLIFPIVPDENLYWPRSFKTLYTSLMWLT